MSAQTRLLEVVENDIIPVRLEENAVRFRVTRLYAEPTSAVRELYANELRACRIARDKHGAKTRIDITLDMSERKLVIHGVDSLGIAEEKFLNVLSVLGETDNTDGFETGQFGWGIAAYASVSDNIVYETFARETGEKFAMLGINGEHFSRLPTPHLAKPGTRVTIYIRDSVNIAALASYIRRLCAYADIDTYLTVAPSGPELINGPDLTRGLPSGTMVVLNEEDYNLVGVFTPAPEGPHVDIRLLSLPIRADSMQFPFEYCVLQIKDERKYRPTADRERLTDEAAEKLQAKISKKLKRVLPSILDINSFDDFRERACKYLYIHGYFHYGVHRNRLAVLEKLYQPSARTAELKQLLQQTVAVIGYGRYGRPVVNRKLLGDIVASTRDVFLVPMLDSKLQDTLRQRYPTAVIFKLLHGRYYMSSLQEVTRQLQEEGTRTDAYVEAEDIKREAVEDNPTRRQRHVSRHNEPLVEDSYTVILHSTVIRETERHGCCYHRLGDKPSQVPLSEVGEETVFVPNIEEYLPTLSEVFSQRSLSRLDKLPKAAQGKKMTLSRFLERQASQTLTTSVGTLTWQALLKAMKPIRLLVYDDPRIVSCYQSKTEEIFVPLSADQTFALALYLRAKRTPYTVTHVPTEEEFQDAAGDDRYRSDYHYRDENYDARANETVNIVFHAALAVKNEKLRRLFFKAAEDRHMSLERLRELRNFALFFP